MPRPLRQKASCTHFMNGILYVLNQRCQVCVCVSSREKTVSSFPDIDPFIQQGVIEQIHILRKSEAEERAKIEAGNGYIFFLKEGIQCRCQVCSFRIQFFLQSRSLTFEV